MEIKELKKNLDDVSEKMVSVGKEYGILYLVILFSLIGYFKPEDEDQWTNIFSLALILLNILFGGFLKNNFQKRISNKNKEHRALSEEILATKEALNKLAIENANLRNAIEFYKK